jgi:predicted metalloprotease
MGAGLGIPGLIILVLFMVLSNRGGGGGFDVDSPLDDLGGAQQPGAGSEPQGDDRLFEFAEFVVGDVQDFWEDSFRQSGKTYERSEMVVFEGGTQSACGGANSQIGPHYCPPDQRIYIDLGFFRQLRSQFDAPGDFAQAYVIAHEVGHHVQNLLGINQQVRNQQESNPDDANELSVRLELQADCFAGVWAFTVYERDSLQSNDLEEGLDAAAAVGDDRIQKQAGQDVNPESWTHGSAAQRQRWFKQGFENGDPNDCDTFSVDEV